MRVGAAGLLLLVILLSACASKPTSTAPIKTADLSSPALKYVKIRDFLVGDLAADIPVLIPVPEIYKSVQFSKDPAQVAYWMRPDEMLSAEKTQDLPVQTGYMRAEISTNVGYDEKKNLFIGVEDQASLASAKSQLTDLRLRRYNSNGYPVLLFQATISGGKKNVYGAYIATKIDTNVVFVALRPPANSSTVGDFIWGAFGRSLGNGK